MTASGGTIVTDETIAAGSSESYTYTVTFTVDDIAAVGTCATGGGLQNNAALGGTKAGQVTTCSDVPDIAIAKTASGLTPTGTPDQYTLTYTVTVDNLGAAGGTYDLADTFTYAGATIDAVSAVTHGGPDPLATTLGTLTATGGTIVTGETIAAGSSETYTYTVTFTLTDPATANDCTNAANGLRNAATLGGSASGSAATCNGAPSVTIAKTVADANGNGIAEPGETLTYTITLTNAGAVDQTNFGVTDPLDANVTFVSADNGGAESGGVVTWSGLAVPANGTLALTVTVTVANPIPSGVTEIDNVAYATGTTAPACPPAGPQCVVLPTPTVNPGTITITKTVEDGTHGGSVEPGEPLTYTITLTNTGGGDVTGFGVTDPLDPNVAFSTANNGGVFNAGVVTWSNLTIPANGSLALIVVVTAADPIPPGVTTIGNFAYETGTTPPDCAATPRPSNCTTIPVTPGAVTITKTVADANGNAEAEPGETLTYTITLANAGGGDATLGLSDPLDANVAFVSADHGGSDVGGTVLWAGLTVPANGTLTLTVVVTVANPIPSGVTAIMNVAYATGSTPADCSATPTPPSCAAIAVAPPAGTAALQIEKTVNTTSTTPGGTLVYTVAVGNLGTAAATNVVVSDPMPNGIASYAWTCSASGGASCPNASGTGAIAATIATLPPGGVVVYTITAQLTSNPPPSITNVANATGASVCAPSGSPPPCTSGAVVAVMPGGGGGSEPVSTPIDSRWMLLLMAIVLTGAAMSARRRT